MRNSHFWWVILMLVFLMWLSLQVAGCARIKYVPQDRAELARQLDACHEEQAKLKEAVKTYRQAIDELVTVCR